MKEINGDIWDYHKKGHWIVITTNGNVKANGEAVMGKGIALQARQRIEWLSYELGRKITENGNKTYWFNEIRIITLPSKHNWWEKADINLIESSIKDLVRIVDAQYPYLKDSDYKKETCLVRPGCSNGQLDWKDVKPILEKYLDDRFIVVEKEEKRCSRP